MYFVFIFWIDSIIKFSSSPGNSFYNVNNFFIIFSKVCCNQAVSIAITISLRLNSVFTLNLNILSTQYSVIQIKYSVLKVQTWIHLIISTNIFIYFHRLPLIFLVINFVILQCYLYMTSKTVFPLSPNINLSQNRQLISI